MADKPEEHIATVYPTKSMDREDRTRLENGLELVGMEIGGGTSSGGMKVIRREGYEGSQNV